MKGISAVIATILMLMITIALAGMAWLYISGYWRTTTSKQLTIQGTPTCEMGAAAGDDETISVLVVNSGTADISASEITIYKGTTSVGNPTLGTNPLPAGGSAIMTITDDCTDPGTPKTCTYRLSYVGQTISQEIYAYCPG